MLPIGHLLIVAHFLIMWLARVRIHWVACMVETIRFCKRLLMRLLEVYVAGGDPWRMTGICIYRLVRSIGCLNRLPLGGPSQARICGAWVLWVLWIPIERKYFVLAIHFSACWIPGSPTTYVAHQGLSSWDQTLSCTPRRSRNMIGHYCFFFARLLRTEKALC